MSIQLTDTQFIALSAAAQREDHCLVFPKTLKRGVARKFAERLLKAGLVQEIKIKQGASAWRRDAATAQSYALKLTAAGLKAISIEADGAAEAAGEHAPLTIADTAAVSATLAAASPSATEPSPAAPREGSKSAMVVGLLRRDHGATLAELVAATGCLPHTTRAALTGLRKRGYAVTRERSNEDRESAYRIAIGRRLEGDGQSMTSETDSLPPTAAQAVAPSADPVDRPRKPERLEKARGPARSATRKAA
ncbi:MAG: DUF3489 domain-containing protein [Hyphomicrobiales bacterium]|nr:DUF3489 domain-containing protein [Hyphomicrobiales bacterium]